jgi:uncharacterized heparinase superfamily protein
MLPSKIKNIGLAYHTLKHLKPKQILWWVWSKAYRPKPDLGPAPLIWPTSVMWVTPAPRPVSMTAPDCCRFFNLEMDIASPDCWKNSFCDKHWVSNLHYFDDLNAPEAEDRLEWHRNLIHRWIAENPPGTGTGWEPYPTALRIVNWIKWGLSGNGLHTKWRDSLAVQARWLFKQIEWHLPGTHLFANAKALVFAGLFFEGEEARRWLDHGMAILSRQMPEQILPDGGHFERSPMVHALAVEDMLDLINLSRTYANAVPGAHRPFVATWPDIAAGMRRYLALLCHPDGGIAFLNDAALGVAPSYADLEQYATRLGLTAIDSGSEGLTHLGDTGYIRMANKDALALLDVAPIGPDDLPGHAHADTLSFELSLFGRRVLVNSGTSEYGAGPERQRQRGTSAHNTVTINGENSSEVWSDFRVARRAKPFGLWVESNDDRMKVSCSHDGYRRLPGQPVHRRFWHFSPGELTVTDSIEGNVKTARARFHFHPDLDIDTGPEGFSVGVGEERQLKIAIDGGDAFIEPATWHPEFGRSQPNQCLDIVFKGDKLTTTFFWK